MSFRIPPAFVNWAVPRKEKYLQLTLKDLLIERQITNDYLEDYESGRVVHRGWGGGGRLTWRQMELAENYNKLTYIDRLIEVTKAMNKYRVEVTKDLEITGEAFVFANSISVTPDGNLVFYTNNIASYGISSGYWIRFKLVSINGEDFNGQS